MQRARHTASLVTALAETQRDSAPAEARRRAHADLRAREVAGERGCLPGRWCMNYKHPRTRRTKTLGMKCSAEFINCSDRWSVRTSSSNGDDIA